MFYVRTSSEGSQDAIASVLTLAWQIISSVNGIVYKDLKQTLRKEQCDVRKMQTLLIFDLFHNKFILFSIPKPSILISTQVPSAKKLIVHGPDLSQIPTQLIVQEETQFSMCMRESFDFFSIPEAKRDRYFLFDVKTCNLHQISNFNQTMKT